MNLQKKHKYNKKKGSSPMFLLVSILIFMVMVVVMVMAGTVTFGNGNGGNGGGGSCMENHVNGIPGNIYNWCYKHEHEHDHANSEMNVRSIIRSLSKQISTSSKSTQQSSSSSSSREGVTVRRVVPVINNNIEPRQQMITAINQHPHLQPQHQPQHDPIKQKEDLCYADLKRLGNTMNDSKSYHQPVIGPCHYDYPLATRPGPKNNNNDVVGGSYEEQIDFFFFRESNESRFTDKLQCLNECVDRALTYKSKSSASHDSQSKSQSYSRNKEETEEDEDEDGAFQYQYQYRQQQAADERALSNIEPDEKVPVDDIMLIEAARAGMTLVVEKLFLKYNLNPFYRQVLVDEDEDEDEEGNNNNNRNSNNSRSLNAIQEAIRGGYAEIVAILTNGDASVIIDEYGRSVEDYVRMRGSPIRPVDALNVLGIVIEETKLLEAEIMMETQTQRKRKIQQKENKNQGQKKHLGWSETSADSYTNRCDFDILDGDINPALFHRDYFITGRPVVLRNQVPPIEIDMFAKHRWYKNERIHPFHTEFTVGPTAYPALTDQESCPYGMTMLELERGDVCRSMPEKPMVHAFHPNPSDFAELYPDFDGNVMDDRGGFRSIRKFFGNVQGKEDVVWQVFFGGDGSGATYHWHEAAFNILYVGVKEWKIAPPLYRGTTGMTAQRVAEVLDDAISLTCVQQPGDLFYIPNYWGHSTFNHGFTIGAAAIVEDWFQNGGATFRGEKEDEEYQSAMAAMEEGEEDGEEEDDEKEGNPPFLFVHINKTGGTSLISMLSDRCEEDYWGGEWYDIDGGYHRAFHATAHAYIEQYGREAWEEAYTFTVVRHPLARQVSNFFFLAAGCAQGQGQGQPNTSNKCKERHIPTMDLKSMSHEEKIEAFHEWILKVYKAFPPGSPEHYRIGAAGHGNEVYHTFGASQTSWLVDAYGNMVVKDVFKLEQLSKDLSTLGENIPCLKNNEFGNGVGNGNGSDGPPLQLTKENKTSKYPNYMLFAKNEQTKMIMNEVFADDFKNFGYDAL